MDDSSSSVFIEPSQRSRGNRGRGRGGGRGGRGGSQSPARGEAKSISTTNFQPPPKKKEPRECTPKTESEEILEQRSLYPEDTRKSKKINANHLANFSFERTTPVYTSSDYRRVQSSQRRSSHQQKERFVQANYRFIVKYDKNLEKHAPVDPDRTVDWNQIEEVHLITSEPYNCPICLDPPLAAKITKCGHVFCFACLLRYFSSKQTRPKWSVCPICFNEIFHDDIRSAVVTNVRNWKSGDRISFSLLQRSKDGLVPVRAGTWNSERCRMHLNSEDLDSKFSRVVTTNNAMSILARESTELRRQEFENHGYDESVSMFVALAAVEIEERSLKIQNELELKLKEKEKEANKNRPPKQPQPLLIVPSPVVSLVNSANIKSAWDDDFIENSEANEQSDPITSSVDQILPTIKHQPNENDLQTLIFDEKSLFPLEDFVFFYQESNGQDVFLLPLDMKILLSVYGSFDRLPRQLTATVVEVEEFTIEESDRRRFKYLNHLPVTSCIQWCEVDLHEIVREKNLKPFENQLLQREQLRRKREKELAEAVRVEAPPLDLSKYIVHMPIKEDKSDPTYFPPLRESKPEEQQQIEENIVVDEQLLGSPNQKSKKTFAEVISGNGDEEKEEEKPVPAPKRKFKKVKQPNAKKVVLFTTTQNRNYK